jgi:UTP--glucose-1-phosphate uridylyltransferase
VERAWQNTRALALSAIRESVSMSTVVRKAVFPVGGLGTRFLPATKAMPKEMLPIVDKPMIHYAMDEARAAGIEQFIFVTGRGKSAIEDHFDDAADLMDELASRGRDAEIAGLKAWLPAPGKVAYTRQQEPLGLGHAVWCARHLIGDEPFAVVLADDLVLNETPCLKQMVDAYRGVGGTMAAVEEVPRELVSRYGVLDIESEEGPLVAARGVVEKPDPDDAPSNLAIIGRYILLPEIFDLLENQKPGAGGEIQLTDALAAMIESGPFHGLRFEGRRFDCGDRAGFLKANIAFALERDDLRDRLQPFLREIAGS